MQDINRQCVNTDTSDDTDEWKERTVPMSVPFETDNTCVLY